MNNANFGFDSSTADKKCHIMYKLYLQIYICKSSMGCHCQRHHLQNMWGNHSPLYPNFVVYCKNLYHFPSDILFLKYKVLHIFLFSFHICHIIFSSIYIIVINMLSKCSLCIKCAKSNVIFFIIKRQTVCEWTHEKDMTSNHNQLMDYINLRWSILL